MPVIPGCPYCKALTSRMSDVHPDHITHIDDSRHRVACPEETCTHYEGKP
jgi:hypothetical protein